MVVRVGASSPFVRTAASTQGAVCSQYIILRYAYTVPEGLIQAGVTHIQRGFLWHIYTLIYDAGRVSLDLLMPPRSSGQQLQHMALFVVSM